MIRISATNEDYPFFSELKAKYGGIDIITGKGFDGSTDLLDVIIQLSPTVLPFVAYIIHEIVGYMKEKKVLWRITLSGMPESSINCCPPLIWPTITYVFWNMPILLCVLFPAMQMLITGSFMQ